MPMERPRSLFLYPAAAVLALLLAACDAESPEGPPATGPATSTATRTALPGVDDPVSPGAVSPGATSPATSPWASPPAASPGATDGAAALAAARSAVETAETAVSNGRAIDIEFSKRRQVWEVGVISGDTEYEVRVSPDGREVLDREDDGVAEAEDRRALEAADVPLSEALGTALGEVEGALDEASLDTEYGRQVWEIEIEGDDGTSTGVAIDTATGNRIR